jgi:hypothetical protein
MYNYMEGYIVPNRFDLMAKYLYIRNYEKRINSSFYVDLYEHHIEVFNKCWEHPGTKKNIDDFLKSLNNLIESFKKNGYNNDYPIEVGSNNVIINGAHRLMLSYYFNLNPKIQKENKKGCEVYNYDFFLNRNNYWRRDNEIYSNLERKYADRMALEYITVKKNVRCMITYPVAYKYNKDSQIKELIKKYGYLYYKKEVKLTKNGVINLIKELYRGEGWIGGMFPTDSCGGKFSLCYEDKQITLYLIEFNDCNKIVEFKERCRQFFNIGKHSLHISDYTIDTFRIASSLLNENSIHFLNNGTNNISQQTKQLLINYFNKLKSNYEDYCLTSSLIMEMYGLRRAKDIDYLHKNNNNLQLFNTGVHSGKWENYYHINKNEIIYNPNNYFYFNGFKFATLNIIKKMKERRNENKDVIDIKLINKII